MSGQEKEANIISLVMPFTDGIGPILSRTLLFSPFTRFIRFRLWRRIDISPLIITESKLKIAVGLFTWAD